MNRVFATSDLHGMYNLWSQIRDYMDETDRLYFLGDAADRGPDGVKIMQEMFADPRVTYLLGNHDQFIVEIGDQIINNDNMWNLCDTWTWIWKSNGGIPTIDSIVALPSMKDKRQFISHIKKLPRSAEYVNKSGQTIFMCHAGTDPGRDEFSWVQEGEKDAYIWNRRHFCTPWPKSSQYKNYYIVHGHTFFGYIQDKECNWNHYPKITNIPFYCEGHKISIDCASFCTNTAVLLDLDSFEQIFFYNDYE